jgi:hypothetical protein
VLFALHEVYYPGDKWLRQAILRFGLGAEVLTCFDRLFEATGPVQERAIEQLAALRRLMDLVEGYDAGKDFLLQEVQVRSIRSLEELRLPLPLHSARSACRSAIAAAFSTTTPRGSLSSRT